MFNILLFFLCVQIKLFHCHYFIVIIPSTMISTTSNILQRLFHIPLASLINDIPDSHTADMIPHTPIVHKQTRAIDLTLSHMSPSSPSTPP